MEYILVASFHVDRGPIMEHQYPGAISGNENMLAELMLPDQVHNRKEDWTIFFLHKDLSEEAETIEGGEAQGKDDSSSNIGEGLHVEDRVVEGENNSSGVDNGGEQDDVDGAEGPPLIYVLNLVNTKHDPSAKRFALALWQPTF